MNNSSKSEIDSPKTPGGISKRFLTPCRGLGLSRTWKIGTVSPFVSPLSSNKANCEKPKAQENCNKKRKQCETEEETNKEGEHNIAVSPVQKNDIVKTPIRNVDISQRKKSKMLLSALNSCEKQNISDVINNAPDNCFIDENKDEEDICNITQIDQELNNKNIVITPSHGKSKKKSKQYVSPLKFDALVTKSNELQSKLERTIKENIMDTVKPKTKNSENTITENSSNNLTKKCIIVIQKNILAELPTTATEQTTLTLEKPKYDKILSQELFDSDSDEVPLNLLNKKEKIIRKQLNLNEDDDFIETKNKKKNALKMTAVVKNKASQNKIEKANAASIINKIEKPLQSSHYFDDDDDDDFEMSKRSIPIRKSYVETTKPIKSKSTGSITQKDIDDLKSRIEMKKKLLLAKAMNVDTEELRNLIKKWQKGCQDALMELIELMKSKFPDKQNMNYFEILKSLKIPTDLVGYDSENDCFVTPDDKTIILSKFNNL